MQPYPSVTASAVLLLGLGGLAQPQLRAREPASPCNLMTRQEAATALGASVPAGRGNVMTMPLLGRQVQGEHCAYGTEVSYFRYALGADAARLFAQYRQSLTGDEGYQSLSGIGDEAFHAKGQIAFRKGQAALIVDVGQNRGGGARELAAEKRLAMLMAGRL